jgi:hypothetical protein
MSTPNTTHKLVVRSSSMQRHMHTQVLDLYLVIPHGTVLPSSATSCTGGDPRAQVDLCNVTDLVISTARKKLVGRWLAADAVTN